MYTAKNTVCGGGKMSVLFSQMRKQFLRPDCCKARRECMLQNKREGKNISGENKLCVYCMNVFVLYRKRRYGVTEC